jgi:hypothetical protein
LMNFPIDRRDSRYLAGGLLLTPGEVTEIQTLQELRARGSPSEEKAASFI